MGGTHLGKMDNGPRHKGLAMSAGIINAKKGINIKKSEFTVSITAGSTVAMQEENTVQGEVEFMTDVQGEKSLIARANEDMIEVIRLDHAKGAESIRITESTASDPVIADSAKKARDNCWPKLFR